MRSAAQCRAARVLRVAVGLATAGSLFASCARRDRTPTSDPRMADDITIATPDTARGIVRRVGADPLSRLALLPVPPRTVPPLALSGAMAAELLAADGLEVMVTGSLTTDISRDVSPGGAHVFAVQRYVVRAADGIEAHDGLLVSQNGRWYLETALDTKVPIVSLPAALASKAGARIFLVGPLSKAPQSFGVLRAK